MKTWTLVLLALSFLVVVSGGVNVNSGKDVVIIGQGGSEGTPPSNILNYNCNINFDPILDYRNPGQYSSRPVEMPDWMDISDHTSKIKTIDNGSVENPGFLFEMSGETQGVGTFSEWRTVKGGVDLNAKRTSSAGYGNISIEDDVLLLRETLESERYGLISQNKNIFFFGRSYREQDNYQNKEDFIQNRLVSGTISKESNYIGLYDDGIFDSDNGAYNLSERFTRYSLDTRFVGSYSFRAISNNGTEIEDDYIGQIAINSKLESRRSMFNETNNEKWLSCCLNESDDAEKCLALSLDERCVSI